VIHCHGQFFGLRVSGVDIYLLYIVYMLCSRRKKSIFDVLIALSLTILSPLGCRAISTGVWKVRYVFIYSDMRYKDITEDLKLLQSVF